MPTISSNHRRAGLHPVYPSSDAGDRSAIWSPTRDRIESVHGSLKDNGDIFPAVLAHLALSQAQQIDALEKDFSGSDPARAGNRRSTAMSGSGLPQPDSSTSPRVRPG
jgi:hypothetical protein